MKDDWKKLIYEDIDLDGKITDYDILENDEILRKAMEKEPYTSTLDEDYESEDYESVDFDDDEDEDVEEDFLEDSDFDEDDDEETDLNDDSGVSFTLSFSVAEPKRTKPTDGIWKYFDESWESWDFAQALIDHFPGLARHYESNSDETLPKIILDAYNIEPSRAFKYLRWLWETFPFEILKEVKEDAFDHPTYKSRAMLVFRLIIENDEENSNDLLKFLCENKTIKAVFYESLIEKHEKIVALDYLKFLLERGKYKEALQVYQAYKEGQDGRISEQDLSDLWDDLFVLCLSEEKIPLWMHEFLQKELLSFKPYSNRAIKSFAKIGIIYPASYQVEDVDCENLIVEIEDDNWISKVPIFRKSVNRSQFTDAINLVYKVSFSTSKDYITESGIWRLIRENGLAEYIGIENQKFNILDKGKAYLELGEKNSIKITYLGQKFLLSKLYKWHK